MKKSQKNKLMLVSALFLSILVFPIFIGCDLSGNSSTSVVPTITLVTPGDSDVGVPVNGRNVKATFSEGMDPATIVAANFTLFKGATAVPGKVTYDTPNKKAVFSPTVVLDPETVYTATVKTGVTDLAGNALAANKVWTFTTATAGAGPDPIILGTAGNFAILSKAGVTTTGVTMITGDVGTSPIDKTALSTFSITMDSTNQFATSTYVVGNLYASDMAVPTPTRMTTAVSDMETAYTDADTRTAATSASGKLDVGAGTLNAATPDFVPGLYTWTTGLNISDDITLAGGPNDTWIFQVGGTLSIAAGKQILLTGGAVPENIFWQVSDVSAIEAGAHMEGIILSQTLIEILAGATINGRLLAQTEVTLIADTVTEPTS